MRVVMGRKYRDKVTGFEGVATAIHQWITGCNTVSIQPLVDKEGKVPDTVGFDVNRLEEVKAPPVPKIDTDRVNGGPQDTPRQNSHK